jgi:ATP-dependent RNA helicase DDX60
MDLDLQIFENPDEISVPVTFQYTSTYSATDALEHIDQAWYTLANKRARWMDLLGDYAGTEPFVIDGMFLALGSMLLVLTYLS